MDASAVSAIVASVSFNEIISGAVAIVLALFLVYLAYDAANFLLSAIRGK